MDDDHDTDGNGGITSSSARVARTSSDNSETERRRILPSETPDVDAMKREMDAGTSARLAQVGDDIARTFPKSWNSRPTQFLPYLP